MVFAFKVNDEVEIMGEVMGTGFDRSWWSGVVKKADLKIKPHPKEDGKYVEAGSKDKKSSVPGCSVAFSAFPGDDPELVPVSMLREMPEPPIDDVKEKPLGSRAVGDAVDYALNGGWWSGFLRTMPKTIEGGEQPMVMFPTSADEVERETGLPAIPWGSGMEEVALDNEGVLRTSLNWRGDDPSAGLKWETAPPEPKLSESNKKKSPKQKIPAAEKAKSSPKKAQKTPKKQEPKKQPGPKAAAKSSDKGETSASGGTKKAKAKASVSPSAAAAKAGTQETAAAKGKGKARPQQPPAEEEPEEEDVALVELSEPATGTARVGTSGGGDEGAPSSSAGTGSGASAGSKRKLPGTNKAATEPCTTVPEAAANKKPKASRSTDAAGGRVAAEGSVAAASSKGNAAGPQQQQQPLMRKGSGGISAARDMHHAKKPPKVSVSKAGKGAAEGTRPPVAEPLSPTELSPGHLRNIRRGFFFDSAPRPQKAASAAAGASGPVAAARTSVAAPSSKPDAAPKSSLAQQALKNKPRPDPGPKQAEQKEAAARMRAAAASKRLLPGQAAAEANPSPIKRRPAVPAERPMAPLQLPGSVEGSQNHHHHQKQQQLPAAKAGGADEAVAVCVDNIGRMPQQTFAMLMNEICPFILPHSAKVAHYELLSKEVVYFGWGAIQCKSMATANDAIRIIESYYVQEPGSWLYRPLLAHIAERDEPRHYWSPAGAPARTKMLLGHVVTGERCGAHYSQDGHLEHDWAIEWRVLERQAAQFRSLLHNEHRRKVAEAMRDAAIAMMGRNKAAIVNILPSAGTRATASRTSIWLSGVGCDARLSGTQLQESFDQFGDVKREGFPVNPATGQHMDSAIIELSDPEQTSELIDDLRKMLFICGGSPRAVVAHQTHTSYPYRSSQSIWDEALKLIDMRNLTLPRHSVSSEWELWKPDPEEEFSARAIYSAKLRELMRKCRGQIKVAKAIAWVQKAKKTAEFHKQYVEAMDARQAMEGLKKDLLLLPEEVVKQL